MSTVAQIDQQTQVFKDAYASGKISFQEYRYAMTVQAANRAAAVEKEKPLEPQSPTDYWTRENPSGNRLIQNPQYGVSFAATPGYQVVEGSIKEEALMGPFLPGQAQTVITYQEQKIPESTPQQQQTLLEPTLQNINSNPLGVAGTILNLAGTGAAILEKKQGYETLGKIASFEVGGFGELTNQATTIKNLGSSIINQPQSLMPYTPKSQYQEYGQTGLKIGEVVSGIVLAPILAPAFGISASSILIGQGVSVGLSQGSKALQGGGLLTPQEALESAAIGGLFSGASGIAFKAVGSLAPSLIGTSTVKGLIGTTSLSAGLGAGGGYVLSGGDLKATGEGALFGVGMLLGGKVLGAGFNAIRSKIGTPSLVQGPKTIGAGGREVETYLSNPLKELGGKRLRVIADVTENPVGSKGVTLKSMIKEYSGRNIPTSHATLAAENFNLKIGGKTLLKGFPSESAGFRADKELYHFYSAPGSKEFVNVYGGYVGVGKGYSGSAKVVFSGKATALTTLDTKVSSEFLRLSKESQTAYLKRTSLLSGKTGLAQETLLGKSFERQLVTPAAYERFGIELPGSYYVSKGKVGTFQIKSYPEGVLGRLPIIKEVFADYTSLTVFKGKYQSVRTGKKFLGSEVVDVAKYNKGYSRTVKLSSSVLLFNPSAIVSSRKSSYQRSNVSTFYKNIPTFSSQKSSKASVNSNPIMSFSQGKESAPSSRNNLSEFSRNNYSPNPSPKYQPSSSPHYEPLPSPSYKPSPSQRYEPLPSPSYEPLPYPRYEPFPITDQQSSNRKKPNYSPYFNKVGGGFGLGSGSSASKGKWRKQDNPVKTVNAMLKTFGLNGKQNSKQSNPILGFKNRKKKRRR